MEDIAQAEVKAAKVGVQELQSGGPPSNNNVNIDLYSTNLTALQQAAKDVELYLKKRYDLKYVTNNFADKQKQVIVNIDPQKQHNTEFLASKFSARSLIKLVRCKLER